MHKIVSAGEQQQAWRTWGWSQNEQTQMQKQFAMKKSDLIVYSFMYLFIVSHTKSQGIIKSYKLELNNKRTQPTMKTVNKERTHTTAWHHLQWNQKCTKNNGMTYRNNEHVNTFCVTSLDLYGFFKVEKILIIIQNQVNDIAVIFGLMTKILFTACVKLFCQQLIVTHRIFTFKVHRSLSSENPTEHHQPTANV